MKLGAASVLSRIVGGGWFFLLAASAPGQLVLSTSGPGAVVRIFNTDLAVLESGERRTDLPCSVTPNKPVLGFDLRFHASYEVTVPLRELAGSENQLTILFRVTAESRPQEPVYFLQRFRVPPIEEDAKGDAYLQGAFDVGEGKYRVEWLMRDRTERVCSAFWETEAVLPPKDRQIDLAIRPGMIEQAEREQFREEPPVMRIAEEQPLNIKILINFAPQNSHAAALQPIDTSALVSILRSIVRDPRLGRFTLVAFNLQQQKVLYRQEQAERIDFPALGEALKSLNLGTVDVSRLAEKHAETSFLTRLLRRELDTRDQAPPDAVIIAGPKALLEEGIPQEALKEIGEVSFPVFYMNYNLSPQQIPWTDAIGKAVKFLKGQEYTISRPRDLWYAVTEIVSRIARSKHGRRVTTSTE